MVIAPPTKAEAAPISNIVYVNISPAVSKYWYWPSRNATNFVDFFTGSDMRIGPCVWGYRCIHIRERYGNYAGITFVTSQWTSYIYLNPAYRGWDYYKKRDLIAHELGHANGIYTHWYLHNPRCTSVMYRFIARCPYTFNSTERWLLARN